MQKRTLTIHRHYEPSDKCLSDAYEILIKRLIERKKKEVEKNDNSGFVCKSLIEETSTRGYKALW